MCLTTEDNTPEDGKTDGCETSSRNDLTIDHDHQKRKTEFYIYMHEGWGLSHDTYFFLED